ncbi:hypothetical protein DICVIV_12266 [Dictyocaulus viviparus]|uniref:Uncharacterized protein n=1 Tax=Dictyocaulus viviparus TaxID=29172 RepID=A0A0D8XDN3_DICVI|nr:hypothetical protein DICVIV_12266 [Dictyocaulus viviparus]
MEKKEIQQRLLLLEALNVMKEEKVGLYLEKKHTAQVKELERAVKEGKKRADSLDKYNCCLKGEIGWNRNWMKEMKEVNRELGL